MRFSSSTSASSASTFRVNSAIAGGVGDAPSTRLGQRAADRRIQHDTHDGNEQCYQDEEDDHRHESSLCRLRRPFKAIAIPSRDLIRQAAKQPRAVAGEKWREGENAFLGLSRGQHRRAGSAKLGELRLLPLLEMLHQLPLHVVGSRESLLLHALDGSVERGIDLDGDVVEPAIPLLIAARREPSASCALGGSCARTRRDSERPGRRGQVVKGDVELVQHPIDTRLDQDAGPSR